MVENRNSAVSTCYENLIILRRSWNGIQAWSERKWRIFVALSENTGFDPTESRNNATVFPRCPLTPRVAGADYPAATVFWCACMQGNPWQRKTYKPSFHFTTGKNRTRSGKSSKRWSRQRRYVLRWLKPVLQVKVRWRLEPVFPVLLVKVLGRLEPVFPVLLVKVLGRLEPVLLVKVLGRLEPVFPGVKGFMRMVFFFFARNWKTASFSVCGRCFLPPSQRLCRLSCRTTRMETWWWWWSSCTPFRVCSFPKRSSTQLRVGVALVFRKWIYSAVALWSWLRLLIRITIIHYIWY